MAFTNNTQSASYSCTALVGSNKAGKLTPDEDGYYTLVLGALDVFNSAGAFYPLATAKHVFESSSSLMRRIEQGNCKGECGHPKPAPGQSTRDFLQRVMQIEEKNVCCHIRSVRLENQEVKDKNGRPVVAVIGQVRPTGPRGPALKEALENRHENVCFSVRSLTKDHVKANGILQKDIKTIVTWDWVTEPGIEHAQRWSSPALESYNDVDFNESHLEPLGESNELAVGMESTGLDLNSVKKELGWGQSAVSAKPPSLNW